MVNDQKRKAGDEQLAQVSEHDMPEAGREIPSTADSAEQEPNLEPHPGSVPQQPPSHDAAATTLSIGGASGTD